MNIVFFGSGKFAVKILDTLCGSGHNVILVVTQPDRKKGRHLHLAETPVKKDARQKGLEVFGPENVNAPQNVAFLKNRPADVFIVVSYGRILSKEILALPTMMSVNIHASLLPKYRGAAPINRALMDGKKITGVTFIKMNELMDQGDILFGKPLKIAASDDAVSLDEKLSALAAKCVGEILAKISQGKVRLKKQNKKDATIAPLMRKQDGLIDWARSATEIINQCRGCAGWPGTFTFFRGKLLKIFSIKKGQAGVFGRPGEIIRAESNILEAACGRGSLVIAEVLPESHKKMPVQSFLAGHQVRIGEILGR